MTRKVQFGCLNPKAQWRLPVMCMATAIMLLTGFVVTPSARAQTFTILYSFTGGADGSLPDSRVIRDSAGNLYGTTPSGGSFLNCSGTGCGTVFKLDTSGNETVLYSFTGGTDGAGPTGGLVRDAAGNLYGTAAGGGSLRCDGGCGVVFMVDTTGKETVLHIFKGSKTDGANPVSGVIRDAAGNLYGTTWAGGAALFCSGGCGTVFKLNTAGTLTIIHSFTGRTGGGPTLAGLTRDAAGNLYGTTPNGGVFQNNCNTSAGPGCGAVFKIDTTGTETVLYSFTGGTDGLFPVGGLVRDAAGNLYGMTEAGGDFSCDPGFGCGTVFKVDTNGKETVLYDFAGEADGGFPIGNLIRDTAGNLYGVTEYGGGPLSEGTVFKLDTAGTETVLYSFGNADIAAYPLAGVTRDTAGNLYGTTSQGGTLFAGTVFKIAP
jgi:uncharacterized repeat protein (TIGR03803 family)